MEIIRFFAERFVALSAYLSDLRSDIHLRSVSATLAEGEARIAFEALPDSSTDILKHLAAFFRASNLNVCGAHAEELVRKSKTEPLDYSDLLSFQANITRELGTCFFFTLLPKAKEYLLHPTSGWEAVIAKFPDCMDDVEEMNKCFALSRYTAAVFHSLLAVEHGLIALGKHIGVTDPKPGWDATYQRLAQFLNNRASLPSGLDFAFLEQTKARLDSMKLAWRNKVNHAAGRLMIERTGFSDVSAEEIIVACRSFMRHLAERLT